MNNKKLILGLTLLLCLGGCKQRVSGPKSTAALPEHPIFKPLPANASPHLKELIDGAISQAGVTTGYDPSYVKLDYPLGDLRHFVFHNLGRHHCHYCCGPVEPSTFDIDAKIPPERGGSFNFHNLAVVCKDCAQAKGWLDHFEYRELINLLRSWAPRIRRNFLARLQAGRSVPLPRP